MRQTFLTIILILVLLATAFVWFNYVRTPEAPVAATATEFENETARKYRKLKNLTPNLSILSDPFFQSLSRAGVDTPLPDIPRGRANPFSEL